MQTFLGQSYLAAQVVIRRGINGYFRGEAEYSLKGWVFPQHRILCIHLVPRKRSPSNDLDLGTYPCLGKMWWPVSSGGGGEVGKNMEFKKALNFHCHPFFA